MRNESLPPGAAPDPLPYQPGVPLVDAGARVLTPSARVVPRDAEARRDSNEWAYVINPTPEFAEKVYYHDMKTDADGYVLAGLVNFTLWQGEPSAST